MLLLFIPPPMTEAVISSCSSSVSPTQVRTNTTRDFAFTVNNTGSSGSIVWVKIVSPGSGNFTINSGSASGWTSELQPGEIIFKSGNIAAGSSQNFTVNATSASTEAAAEAWGVQVSDDSTGLNPTECSGNPSITISNGPVISNIVVSDLTFSSVKISWTTDVNSDSVVKYGTTVSYGLTKSDPALVTSHSLTLTGLSANTTYHYQVSSKDATGNTSSSSDNTFLTPLTPPPPPPPPPPALVEQELPKVTLKTSLESPFTEAPTIQGTATDNIAVSKVEYSIDNGRNWLPASSTGLGRKSVDFSFKPQVAEEGNYPIVVRATDSSGNRGFSTPVTLIIDRFAPTVGGSLLSLGPQLLQPPASGIITTITGIDQKITLSAIGGATDISILATKTDNPGLGNSQLFTLVRSEDTKLWSGVLSFGKPGAYRLTARAVDGVGKRTERTIAQAAVIEAGMVTDAKTKNPVAGAEVRLYVFSEGYQGWVLWDGKAYSQTNPQATDKDGRFSLYLPQGKYYLEIRAPGYEALTSKIFVVDKPTPLGASFSLKPKFTLIIGPFRFSLPDFFPSLAPVDLPPPPQVDQISPLIGKEAPFFSLPSTAGTELTTFHLRGKPAVLSFISTWSPPAVDQILILEKLGPTVKVVPITTQETLAQLRLFQNRGGYKVPIFVDQDGQLVEKYLLGSLPTHFFVDRKGIIQKVVAGVLTEQELTELLNKVK